MGLNETKTALKECDVRPSKRLGQNFLIDGNIREKMLRAVSAAESDTIIEIGPGLGALTKGLSDAAGKVIAIEKDKRLCEFLRKNIRRPNLEILNADILDCIRGYINPSRNIGGSAKNLPEGQIFLNYLDGIGIPGKKIKVVGNLPYYITSPIITGLLKKRSSFSYIFVTIQNEFADRLAAPPGSREYGAISCFARFYADISTLFRIKRTCFYPVPKVGSSFVRLTVKESGLCLTDEKKLFKIIRTSFAKRRKTIFNSLKSCDLFLSSKDLKEALIRAGISHERRPETVSLEEFITLAKEVNRDR